MVIRQFKSTEEYVKELSKELKNLFRKEDLGDAVFERYFNTTKAIASKNNNVIACLSERLIQGGVFIYPYRFDHEFVPTGFRADILDNEVDGLLYMDKRDMELSDGTYHEKFCFALKKAYDKFG